MVLWLFLLPLWGSPYRAPLSGPPLGELHAPLQVSGRSERPAALGTARLPGLAGLLGWASAVWA